MAGPEPFLRWAGGKRWLAQRLAPLLKTRLSSDGRYIEPFLGSGSMFFAINPERALLSDLNAELVAAFEAVRKHPTAIRNRLRQLPASQARYNRIRRWQPRSLLDRAVRFIYLNRTSYGGLYRENRKGVYNVPFGGGDRDHTALCENGALWRAGRALNKDTIQLRCCDFALSLIQAGPGDVVYCDPTYREVTRRQFDRYGKTVFDWDDQDLLARLARQAFKRGALVVLSNATCNGIRELYPEALIVTARRRKGFGPECGHDCREYLLVLDPMRETKPWKRVAARARRRATRKS